MDAIFATFLELCRPYELPPRWATIASKTEAFVTREETSSDALAALRSQYLDQDLLATGLVEQADGLITLHPNLAPTGTLVLPLRSADDGQIFSLLTESGSIGGPSDKAFFLMFSDIHTLRALCARPMLLVAATLEDVIVLRS